MELVFHASAGGPRKTLYYVSTDLAGRYDPKKGFGRFVALKGQHDTLVKSASYLLHAPPFASLRKHILETSTSILQDDTGVPYRELQKDPWRVQLFGHYSAPNAPFKKKFQQDLSDAFEIPGSAHELGFSIGYGYKQRTSSMILATRSARAMQTHPAAVEGKQRQQRAN